MRALLIGGSGFIGSHLLDNLLNRNIEVINYDNLSRGKYKNSRSENIVGDILDADHLNATLFKYKPSYVFHMAAHHYIPYCEANIYDAFNVNVNGTLNVINAVSKCSSVEKLFFASTGDVYAPTSYPNSESDYLAPVYNYGETKLLCEKIITRWKKSNKLDVNIVIGRLFNASGSRETNPHLLPQVAKQILSGAKTISIGNSWPMRDFVDVVSMADVICDLTLSLSFCETINVGSGSPIAVKDAINLFINEDERKFIIVSNPEKCRPADRPFLCPDVSHLKNVLGRACLPFSKATVDSLLSGDIQY